MAKQSRAPNPPYSPSDIARAVELHGLTPKQAKLAHEYVNGEHAGIKVQAALAAYDTTSTENARQMAYETLRKPHVQSYMQQLLEQSGIGDEVRTGLLADIARGKSRSTKTVTHRYKS